MRIDNQCISDLSTATRATSVNEQASHSSGDELFPRQGSGDQVSLSNGQNLVALAKGTQESGRQAKILALQAQVRSGAYHPDLSEVSHAMVQELSGERAGATP
jgi:hypothetical protein